MIVTIRKQANQKKLYSLSMASRASLSFILDIPSTTSSTTGVSVTIFPYQVVQEGSNGWLPFSFPHTRRKERKEIPFVSLSLLVTGFSSLPLALRRRSERDQILVREMSAGVRVEERR